MSSDFDLNSCPSKHKLLNYTIYTEDWELWVLSGDPRGDLFSPTYLTQKGAELSRNLSMNNLLNLLFSEVDFCNVFKCKCPLSNSKFGIFISYQSFEWSYHCNAKKIIFKKKVKIIKFEIHNSQNSTRNDLFTFLHKLHRYLDSRMSWKLNSFSTWHIDAIGAWVLVVCGKTVMKGILIIML